MKPASATSWTDIQAEVMRRIRTRVWQPGDLIPGEIEMAREFGCARATISRALRALADEGVLDRRRRAGTRVALTPVRRATLSIPVIRREVEARGALYRHSLLSRSDGPASPAITARMGLAAGTRLLHLQTLHLADDRPWCFEDRWINPAAVPAILDAPLSQISANEWLVQNAFFSDGDIAFQAEAASPALAEILSVPTGAPLFTIERATRTETQPITSVRISYPPGHRVTTTLTGGA